MSSSFRRGSSEEKAASRPLLDRRRRDAPRNAEELSRARSFAVREPETVAVERSWHSFRGQRRGSSFSVVGDDDMSSPIPSPMTPSKMSTIDFLQNFQVRRNLDPDEESLPPASPLVQRRRRPDLKRLDSASQILKIQEEVLPSLSLSATGELKGTRQTKSGNKTPSTQQSQKKLHVKTGPLVLPTPLYDAVSSGAPIRVIESLVQSDRSSTSLPNGGGLTPLHCAIERYDTKLSVLLLLLRSNPEAAAMRCKKGQNSVDLLWKRYVDPDPYRTEETRDRAAALRREMESVAGSAEDFPVTLNPSTSEQQRQSRAERVLEESSALKEFWDTMKTFIHAACDKGLVAKEAGGAGKLGVVHEAVKLTCDPLLIRFAAALHPDQLLRREAKSNRLPLHLAAMGGESSESNLRTLIALSSDAASESDAEGRLPLHLAIESGVTWEGGMQALIKAYPESLTTIDPKTQLLPFLLAAIAAGGDLNAVFNLLRSSPSESLQMRK